MKKTYVEWIESVVVESNRRVKEELWGADVVLDSQTPIPLLGPKGVQLLHSQPHRRRAEGEHAPQGCKATSSTHQLYNG